jgi:hypothetical protein
MSPARIAWWKDFHRNRRNGLSGSVGETTWAILASNQVVGSVRLKRTAVPEILETGIWLTRRTVHAATGWADSRWLVSCRQQPHSAPRVCERRPLPAIGPPCASCEVSDST